MEVSPSQVNEPSSAPPLQLWQAGEKTVIPIFTQDAQNEDNVRSLATLLVRLFPGDTIDNLHTRVAHAWKIPRSSVQLLKLHEPWNVMDPTGLADRLRGCPPLTGVDELYTPLNGQDQVVSFMHDLETSVFLGVRSDAPQPLLGSRVYPSSWAAEWYTRVRMEREDPFRTLESGDTIMEPSIADAVWRDAFFIRPEYETLWKYATLKEESLTIYGHTGIGKTYFLYYALLKALQSPYPILFSPDFLTVLYFDDLGVRYLEPGHILSLPRNTLALLDTDSPVSNAAKTTMFWTILTTTPDHQPSWPYQRPLGPRFWVMDVWSEKEIASLTRISKTQEGLYTPSELFPYVGPSARMCKQKIEKIGELQTDIDEQALEKIFIPNHALDYMASFLSKALQGVLPCVGRSSLLQYFFLAPTSPMPVRDHSQGSAIIIPNFFLLSRVLEAIRAPARERTLMAIQDLHSRFPVVSGQLFDTMAFADIAHHPLHCVVGTKQYDLPTLPIQYRPGVFSGNEPFDHDAVYASPSTFSAFDALVVQERGTRFTFLQIALTTPRATISGSEITTVLDALAATGRPLDNARISFIFMVGEEEAGRDLARALSNGADWIRCGYQTNRTVDIEVGYAVVERPVIPYVPSPL